MSKNRVLIVDDERLTGIALADYLEEEGFQSAVAEDGQTAIKLQKQHPFDVCIVDIRMPGMDGVEAILTLHQISSLSRFVVCTGSPQFTVPDALKAIGVAQQAVVLKPILDMQVFVNLLKTITSA